MSAKVRYPLGRIWVEVEAESVREAIRDLSDYVEVFSESQCGLCESEQIRPSYKVAKGYDFYELMCCNCGARLSFGQTKEGQRLFAKRRDGEGREIGVRGWYRYEASRRESDVPQENLPF
jgi:hypothetical protein